MDEVGGLPMKRELFENWVGRNLNELKLYHSEIEKALETFGIPTKDFDEFAFFIYKKGLNNYKVTHGV